jgi:hypothetical protein
MGLGQSSRRILNVVQCSEVQVRSSLPGDKCFDIGQLGINNTFDISICVIQCDSVYFRDYLYQKSNHVGLEYQPAL